LEAEHIEVRLACEVRDHPLFVVPRDERERMLSGVLPPNSGQDDATLSQYVLRGELCHKCRSVYAALLASYNGDYLKILRHVQVERFYLSRRYQIGAVTIEPQVSVDAGSHQVTAGRSQANLPSALHNTALFTPHGPLVSANRGIV